MYLIYLDKCGRKNNTRGLGKKHNYTHTQKGPKTRCKNYTALCLPTVIMKLHSRILDRRVRKEIEDKLEEEQGTLDLLGRGKTICVK
jgi:hypothetical protein